MNHKWYLDEVLSYLAIVKRTEQACGKHIGYLLWRCIVPFLNVKRGRNSCGMRLSGSLRFLDDCRLSIKSEELFNSWNKNLFVREWINRGELFGEIMVHSLFYLMRTVSTFQLIVLATALFSKLESSLLRCPSPAFWIWTKYSPLERCN